MVAGQSAVSGSRVWGLTAAGAVPRVVAGSVTAGQAADVSLSGDLVAVAHDTGGVLVLFLPAVTTPGATGRR